MLSPTTVTSTKTNSYFALKCMAALAAAAVAFLVVSIIVAVPELIFAAAIIAMVAGLCVLLGATTNNTYRYSARPYCATTVYPGSVYVAPSGPGFFSNLFNGLGTHTNQHRHGDGFTSHQTGTRGFFNRNAEVHVATAAPSHGNTHVHR
jgi:hypothetical protein